MLKTKLILDPFSFQCHSFIIPDFGQTNFAYALLV